MQNLINGVVSILEESNLNLDFVSFEFCFLALVLLTKIKKHIYYLQIMVRNIMYEFYIYSNNIFTNFLSFHLHIFIELDGTNVQGTNGPSQVIIC